MKGKDMAKITNLTSQLLGQAADILLDLNEDGEIDREAIQSWVDNYEYLCLTILYEERAKEKVHEMPH